MSIEAMTRALSSVVGDTTRKFVLTALGNHAHKDGRHSWPSIETIAEYVECSERTVQRALRRLEADGFIREGDQQQVAHLRPDKRPTVYDVAMDDATRDAWKAEATATERGDTVSPGHAGTGRQAVTPSDADGVTSGVTPMTSRGDTGVTQTVLNPGTSPIAPNGNGSEISDPSTQSTSGISARTCQRHGTTRQPNCRGCGTTQRQIDAQAAAAAAEQRRRADQAAIEADRARKAERLSGDEIRRHLEQVGLR